jgi:DNA-directed RNA polymerase subunit beta'
MYGSLKVFPSKMALLLDLTPRNVESVIYFASFIVTEIDGKRKAEAISAVEKDLEKAKITIQKELDLKLKEFEDEISKLGKSKMI